LADIKLQETLPFNKTKLTKPVEGAIIIGSDKKTMNRHVSIFCLLLSYQFLPLHFAASLHTMRSIIAAAIAVLLLFSCVSLARAQQDLTSPLLQAAKSADPAKVRDLLKQGADIRAKDVDGNSALMLATLYATPETMRMLMDNGAEPNHKNKAGATALMWAVGDLDKVKLLVDRGANVNVQADVGPGFTPLIMAADSPAGGPLVRFLLDRGADVNLSTKSGFTPLMAALAGGDPEAISLILDKKPNVRAANPAGWTAMHAAARLRNPAVVKRLLDMGAEAQPKKNFQNRTPLHWVAMSGDPTVVQLLLDHGADVNARESFSGTTALILAAALEDSSTELAKLLASRGADLNAKDDAGNTAWVWATRAGNDSLAKWLEQQGTKPPVRPLSNVARPLITNNTVDKAVRRTLPLLQRVGPSFMSNSEESCASCHHQSLPALALDLARQRGFPVNQKSFRDQAEETRQILADKRELILQGMGLPDRLDPAYFLVGLAAAKLERDQTTDALVHSLTLKQAADGHWSQTFYRPPMDGSDFTATALSLRALQCYGFDSADTKKRMDRARAWLTNAVPKNTEDAAFQLLGLGWAQASKDDRDKAKVRLLAMQRSDGGWGQLRGLDSDAYATGQVLVALCQAGDLPATDPAYRRGVDFLLKSQQEDGSWVVAARSIPLQPYFESGFPHGRSQFISCAATCWATMALTLAGS
jgi:ankyrin repeat protein